MPANWQSFAFTLLTEPMTELGELTQKVLAFKLMEFTQVALAFTLLTELTQVIAFTELMKRRCSLTVRFSVYQAAGSRYPVEGSGRGRGR